jgi:peptidyl-dipeptidase Dcp
LSYSENLFPLISKLSDKLFVFLQIIIFDLNIFGVFLMKFLYSIIILGLMMFMNVFSQSAGLDNNPLLKPYNTPFNVPPFDKIKTEHFMPAFKEAIRLHDEEIKKILSNPETPTFENTVEALEYSGELLNDIATVFFNLNSANTSDEIQAIARDVAPMLSAHSDNINLNKDLYKRIEIVYKQKSKLKLAQDEAKLLEETYKTFNRGGAGLDEKNQERFREINQKLSTLTLKFGENTLAETNSYKLIVENKENLSGLTQQLIDAAAEKAKSTGNEGKWVFTLNNSSLMPFLQYADNRDLREKIWTAYKNRGNNNNENDNKQIIKDLVNLRLERSKLLGYKSYADYALEVTMAKSPKKVDDLLMKLWKPSLKIAQKDAKDLQTMINKEKKPFKLAPWDWRYYSEKVRKEKYDLNEEEIMPYLKLENVRDGIFTLTGKLYGIKFVERKDIPKYSDEAVVYEVLDKDGSHLAIIYMDFHPRANKNGGAWMTNYIEQHFEGSKMISPVVSLVCNFSRPTGDLPSLLNWDEAETFFHEFGHGLHGMFSKCKYKSLAGTNVSRDFVEMPSQIMENWVVEPEVLAFFAKHYKTGEIMPNSLIQKIQNSSKFGQGFATVEYLAASLLDMKYHTITSEFKSDVNQFEDKTLKDLGLIPEIISRYRSTYFNHTFTGGYSAGYYSYIWAGVLDADAYQAFKEKGIFNTSVAESFRKNILEKGNTDDAMKLYVKFRGAEPSIEPLLIKRGLK